MLQIRHYIRASVVARAILAVVTLSSCGAGSVAAAPAIDRQYDHADDLRDAIRATKLLQRPSEAELTATRPPYNEDEDYLWIVDYLASDDPDLRSTAADAIAHAERRIRASALAPFMERGNPADVRIAAAAGVLRGYAALREEGGGAPGKVARKYIDALSRVLNDLTTGPVPAVHFHALARSLASNRELPPQLLGRVSADHQELFARRLLQCYVGGRSEKLRVLYALGGATRPATTVAEVCRWYEIEPDPFPRNAAIRMPRDWSNLPAYRPLLELAVVDPDFDCGRDAELELRWPVTSRLAYNARPWAATSKPTTTAAPTTQLTLRYPDELRKAAAELLRPEKPADQRAEDTAAREGRGVWIVDYLSADDVNLRTEAASIVAEAHGPLRASRFIPLVGRTNPTDVRMAATAVVLRGYVPPDEGQRPTPDRALADEKVRSDVAAVLNLAARARITPLNFYAVATAPQAWRDRETGVPIGGLIDAEHQHLYIRRTLACLRYSRDELDRRLVLQSLQGVDPKVWGEEILDWYRAEADESVRKSLLEPIAAGPEVKANYRELWRLGTLDPDAANAQLARHLLGLPASQPTTMHR